MNNFIIEYKYEASKLVLEFDGFNNRRWSQRMMQTSDYKIFSIYVKSIKIIKSAKRFIKF